MTEKKLTDLEMAWKMASKKVERTRDAKNQALKEHREAVAELQKLMEVNAKQYEQYNTR